jgi:hypothetical protein
VSDDWNIHPGAVGGFADLTVKNDVAGELDLDKLPGAMRTLEFLADQGGEVAWSWDNIKPATREMVADLIQYELVKEMEYVTSALQLHGRLALRLTDKGRNVVSIHRQRKIVASEVKPIGGSR